MNHRKRRMEILSKIDALSIRCECTTQAQRETCSNCKAVAALGEELNQLSYAQKQAKSVQTLKVITSYRKNAREALIMTIDEYLAFKRDEMTDRKVAEAKGVSPSTIGYWKKKHAEEIAKMEECMCK